ncbi:MAG: hypothetical protein PHY79_16700, partial [Anaerolineae bacterium]|nr:hypothetical protein [Anaerolineae bacterium]
IKTTQAAGSWFTIPRFSVPGEELRQHLSDRECYDVVLFMAHVTRSVQEARVERQARGAGTRPGGKPEIVSIAVVTNEQTWYNRPQGTARKIAL